RGRIILLTNARTASAAEVFAASLREAGRARVVGETTCGCVLGIRRRHQLPDGGVLDISEMNYHTAGGVRLEGRGLSPDEQITPTREDLRRGRDRAVELALEILKVRK
ncbi:MAG: peptidase S41, partial [Rubrivivax sp.]|nr:peptidase S41 [Pyrinomonadaceae bacterium]